MQIQHALNDARSQLSQSESSLLDAELLLAYAIGKNREFLLTWPETELSETEQQGFLELVGKRALGHPIAHLIGNREFWSFELTVNSDVLIPRPETELLIEIILQQLGVDQYLLADLGTGSGAIGLALAKELPKSHIVASDVSNAAIEVAKLNAHNLNCQNIEFRHGAWLDALNKTERFDAIISNPPYIDKSDTHLKQGDVRFEPRLALVAASEGLADLDQIISKAQENLKPNGILLLEHGYQQAEAVRQLLKESEYNEIQTYNDLAGHERATMARK